MIFVRYEALWRHVDALRAVFPDTGPFPEFIPRRSRLEDVPGDLADGYGYARIYGGAVSRMAELPDVFTLRNGVRHVLS